MSKFYEFDLHEAGCLTYLWLPVWGLVGLATYLENHHIPYEVCFSPDISGETSGTYYFRGESGWDSFALKSGMDPLELLTLAEGLFYIPFNEIGEEFCPVPERYAGCMPADLFVDDANHIWMDCGYPGATYRTVADWLWELYDHTVLDEEGALTLSRWIYKIAPFRRSYEDDLRLQAATRHRPEIDHRIYVANFNHTVCEDKNGHVVEIVYYDENDQIAWVENMEDEVIWGERPPRRNWSVAIPSDEEDGEELEDWDGLEGEVVDEEWSETDDVEWSESKETLWFETVDDASDDEARVGDKLENMVYLFEDEDGNLTDEDSNLVDEDGNIIMESSAQDTHQRQTSAEENG